MYTGYSTAASYASTCTYARRIQPRRWSLVHDLLGQQNVIVTTKLFE